MEQPRFGGVALPPLSTSDGEGKSPEFVPNTMDSTKPSPQDLHCPITNNARSEAGETDPDVQKVMEVLHRLGIFPCLERHRLKDERRQETNRDDGVYCKNLLLKDKKGQAYLILCAEDDTANLQVVKYHLNTQGNLHFASKNSLWNLLQVYPGAVSPLALINSHGDVRVFIDASLKKRIDRDSTKLYFHPLKAELQVGLTLSQLEMFLHHCSTTLEILPSLVSYSARRQYSNLTGGHHYKLKSNPKLQKHHFTSKLEDPTMAGMQEERPQNKHSLEQEIEQQEKMKQAKDTFQQCADFLQQLGISVDVAPDSQSQGASNYTILPCRSVYLKDKRNNYFLFICHENQKIDFSSLKAQLKPKKKIEPLDKEELWSLLHLSENREHPFALVQLEHPKFVVAISDNLQYKGKAVLTFPHPADPSLRLEITLKDLEMLITNTSHDMITIQMRGNIEDMQAISTSYICSTHSKPSPHDNKVMHPSEAENDQLYHSDYKMTPAYLTERQRNNLFYQLTAPLRDWVLRCIRGLVKFLNSYLPSQILVMLRKSSLWRRIQSPESTTAHDCPKQNEDWTTENEGQTNGWTNNEKDKTAKIAKLQQLIAQSEVHVDLKDFQPTQRFLKGNPEQCKTYLLENDIGQLIVVFCTEEDKPTWRNLRHLRTAFRFRSPLHLASDARMLHSLAWPENNLMSWTSEDLNPMALMDMNLRALGRVRVGMTGALYSFSDTTLSFELPSLGVTLQMNAEDLEKMVKSLGFCIVYLP